MSIFQLGCRFASLNTKANTCRNEDDNAKYNSNNDNEHFETDVLESHKLHAGKIQRIETSVQIPYVASAGNDNVVHVFNYVTGELIVSKEFASTPLSISFHPSGLQMLIVFADEVLAFHICVDELKMFWRLAIRTCRYCAYSNGGQRFALADNNLIHIFNFLSGEKECDLKGHSSKIVQILWMKGDRNVIAHDERGCVCQWDLSLLSRELECIQFKQFCSDMKIVQIDPEQLWLLEDGNLKSVSSTLVVDDSIDIPLHAIHRIRSPLIASNEPTSFCIVTLDGATESCSSLRIYDTITREHADISFEDNVTAISLSPKDNSLIVGFESGMMSVYNLMDLRGCKALLTEVPNLDMEVEVESISVLVNRVYLQEIESVVTDLCARKKEMQENYEYRAGLRSMAQTEDLARLKDAFKGKSDRVALVLQTLEDKIKKMNRRHQIEIENQDEMARADTGRVERESKATLLALCETYDTLKDDISMRIDVLAQEKRGLSQSNDQDINDIVTDWQSSLEKQRTICNRLVEDVQKKRADYKECINQIEFEVDHQIEMKKTEHKDSFSRTLASTLKASSENGIMQKRFAALQRHIDDQKETIKILLLREEDMREQVKRLEESEQELRNRYDETSISKNKKTTVIARLTVEKKELEKCQCALNEKHNNVRQVIRTTEDTSALRNAIGEEIAAQNDLIGESREIKKYIAFSSHMIKRVQRDISNQQKNISTQQRRYKRTQEWLLAALDCIQSPSELLSHINKPIINGRGVSETGDNADAPCSHEKEMVPEEVHVLRETLDESVRTNNAIGVSQQMEYDSIRSRNQEMLNVISSKRQELNTIRLKLQMLVD